MRFIIAAFMAALVVPLALAQNTSSSAHTTYQIPDCAVCSSCYIFPSVWKLVTTNTEHYWQKFCLASFSDRSTCALEDLACICPKTALKVDITKCVVAECSIKEALCK